MPEELDLIQIGDPEEQESPTTKPQAVEDTDLEMVSADSLIQDRKINVTSGGLDARKEAVSLPRNIQMQERLEDYEKWTGDYVNPFSMDMRKMRAEGQSSFGQFLNMSAQLVGGELIGGAVEISGYMLEVPKVLNYLRGEELKFGNGLSQLGKSMKEGTREMFPIHATTEGGFNPHEWSWWMSNGASIASSIAIAIPTGLAIGGIGMALKGLGRGAAYLANSGKAVKVMNKSEDLVKAINNAVPGLKEASGVVGQSLLARHSDNMIESSMLFDEKFKEYTDEGFSEERATELAARVASLQYQGGYALLLNDVFQYFLFRRFAKQGGVRVSPERKLVPYAMGGEAVEESYQYWLAEEAAYHSDIEAGLVKPHSFGERSRRSFNGDMLTGAVFGALGAGVMQGSAAMFGRATGMDQPPSPLFGKHTTITKPPEPDGEGNGPVGNDPDLNPEAHARRFDDNQLAEEELHKLDPEQSGYEFAAASSIIPFAIDAAAKGNVKHSKDLLNSALESSVEDLQKVFGEQEQFREDLPERVKSYMKEFFDVAVQEFNKNRQFGKIAKNIAGRNTRAKLSQRIATDRQAEYVQIRDGIPNFDTLSKTGKNILNYRVQEKAYKQAIDEITKLHKEQPEKYQQLYDTITKKSEEHLKRVNKQLDRLQSLERKPEEKADDTIVLEASQDYMDDLVRTKTSQIMGQYYAQYNRDKAKELREMALKRDQKDEEPQKADPQEAGRQENNQSTQRDSSDFVETQELPKDGSYVRRAASPNSEVYQVMEVDGQFYIKDESGKPQPVSDADMYKNWTVVKTPESNAREKAEEDSKKEDSDIESIAYDRDKARQALKKANRKKKSTILTGAWISTNNPEYTPTVEPNPLIPNYLKAQAEARTIFFENGQPIQKGTYGIARVHEEFLGDSDNPLEMDFDSITISDSEAKTILDTPIVLNLYNTDGSQISVNTPTMENVHVELPIHNSGFIGNTQETSELARTRLFNLKKTLLQGISQGKQMSINIKDKSSGHFNFTDRDSVHNVFEVLEQAPDQQINPEDVKLAVLFDDMQYKDGQGVPEGFELMKPGNPEQIGRVYAAITDVAGRQHPLPLERSKLSRQEADIVYNILRDLIGKPDPNNQISQDIKNQLLGNERTAPLFDFISDPTYLDALNFIVFEHQKTLNSTHPFHLNFKTKLLTLGDRTFTYDQIRENSMPIVEELQNQPWNVNRKLLNTEGYNDFLINNDILYVNIEPGNVVLQNPTIYFEEGVHEVGTKEDQTVTETSKNIQEIENIFEETPELAQYGSTQQYSQYLNTIFPDSQINDIVYHGTDQRFGEFNIKEGYGAFFSSRSGVAKEQAKLKYGDNVKLIKISALLDVQNPKIGEVEGYDASPTTYIEGHDSLIMNRRFEKEVIVVPKSSQIHILGSEKDIEGFKNFIENQTSSTEDQTTTPSDSNAPLTNISSDPRSAEQVNKQVENQQKDQDSKENLWNNMIDKDTDSNDKIMQRKELINSRAGNLVPILDNLSMRTGWDYTVVNNPDLSWAGKVEGRQIFINTAHANETTPFHEYAHPIIRDIQRVNPTLYANLTRQLRETKEGQDVYNRIKQVYPNYDTNMLVEESIVQLIGQLAADNVSSSVLVNAIRRIWNTILSYLQKLMPTVDLAGLSMNVTFADIANLMRSNSFINTLNDPMWGYSQIRNDYGAQVFDNWVNTLMSSVLIRQNIVGRDDVSNIDLSILVQPTAEAKAQGRDDSVMATIGRNAQSNQHQEMAKHVFMSIVNDDGTLNNDAPIIQAIKDRLATFGIVEKTNKDGIDENSHEVVEEDRTRLRNHKSHYEINGKEKVTSDVKMVMSFIPRIKSNKVGKQIKDSPYTRDYVLNPQTGLPEFHTFSDIWNTTLDQLANTIETQKIDSDQRTFTDVFDTMIDKLHHLTEWRPEFQILIDRLQSKAEQDPSIRPRFVRAFYVAPQNYLSMVVDREGNWRTVEKNPQSPETYIMEEWQSDVISKFSTLKIVNGEEVLRLDNGAYNQTVQAKNKYSDIVGKYIRQPIEDGNIPQELLDAGISALSRFGIEVNDREFRKYLHDLGEGNYRKGYKEALSAMEYFTKRLEEMKNTDIKPDTKWFPTSDSNAKPLAEVISFFRRDISDNNVLGPDGKPYYNYAPHNMMSKRIEEWKQNPQYLEQLRTQPYYESSLWADHIMEGKDINVHNFMNFKTYKDKGTKPRNMSFPDRVASYINMTINGYYPLHARGANSTEFMIKGPQLINSYIINGNNISVSNQALDVFMNYVYDEYNRIYTEQEYLATNPEKKIQHYHDVQEDGTIPALQMQLFPELMNDSFLFDENGKARRYDRDQVVTRNSIRKQVKQLLNKEVIATRNEIKELGIYDSQAKENIGIDKDTFDKYRKKAPRDLTLSAKNDFAINAIAFDYTINSMIANKEQQKLFSGDPALYGDQSNLQKRILAAGTQGYSLYMEGQPENYISAVIQDIIVGSKEAEYFEKIGIPGYSDGINKADAQAYVTKEFFLELLYGYGKLNPDMMDLAIRLEENIKDINTIRDVVRQVNQSDLTYQSLKNVHAELHFDPQEGLAPRFIYDKQTIVPLFSELIEGTHLERLEQAMKHKGIDHVSTESGVKTGAVSPTQIHDEEGNILPVNQIKFTPYTQSRRFTFLQQELPKKGFKNGILEASQVKYNIIADIQLDQQYGKRNGSQTIEAVHAVQRRLAEIEIENLSNEIMTDTNRRGKKFDPVKANARVIKEFKRRGIDHNLIKGLEKGYLTEALVSHNIPIQNVQASIINEAAVKTVHSHGGSAIQISSLGFVNRSSQISPEIRRGITWLTDEQNLKPPILDEDGKLHPGSILLPHHILEQYPDIVSNPELTREILSGADYRIPNQKISNIGFVEVVGILPPEAGDSVVVYDEITKKTGSDFDVDKMQIMLYNIHPRRFEKIRYFDEEGTPKNLARVYDYRLELGELTDTTQNEFIKKYEGRDPLQFNSKLAIENHKLDIYRDIMSNEDMYKKVMEVLEDDTLERTIKNAENFDNADPRRKFNPLNGMYQAIAREVFLDANSAVGAVANHIIDNVKSQHTDQWFWDGDKPLDLRTGTRKKVNVDGQEITASILSSGEDINISKTLSMIMDSQVDAEKDPWAATGNINIETISPILTMVRFGIDIPKITRIIDSNIIRRYIANKRRLKSSFGDWSETALNKTLQHYDITYEEFVTTPYNPNPESPAEILKFYNNIEEVSTTVSDGIKASKFHVDGTGKDIFDNIALTEARSEALFNIPNFERKFVTENGQLTIEGAAYENSIEFFKETFGSDLIANTPQFRGTVHNGISEGGLIHMFRDAQNTDLTNRESIKQIYNGSYAYIMNEVFMNHPEYGTTPQELISKDTSVAKDLAMFKDEHDFHLTNLLQPVFGNKYDMIAFPNSLQFGESERNILYDDWVQIHKIDPDFARRLAQYAYASSGFSFGINSFFQFMPVEIMDEFGVAEYTERIIRNSLYSNDDTSSEISLNNAFTQIIRNNPNSSLLPKAYNSRRPDGKKDVRPVSGNDWSRITLISTKDRFKNPPKYLNYNDNLYEKVDKKEYQQIDKLGFYVEGGFKMVEYSQNQIDPETSFADMQEKKKRRKSRVVHVQEGHKILNPTKGQIKENTRDKPKQKEDRSEAGIDVTVAKITAHFSEKGMSNELKSMIASMPDYTNLEEYIKQKSQKRNESEIIEHIENTIQRIKDC